VHVVCKQRQRRSFLCAIRLPQRVGKALYVRYQVKKNGDDVFHWSGYKKS
jgi:hypothetical protein